MSRLVIVTGGRDLTSPAAVFEALNGEYLAAEGRLLVAHGACPTGADAWASEWVRRMGACAAEFPFRADWDSCAWDCPAAPHRVVKRRGDVHHLGMLPDFCPGAGPRRNARMVAAGGDLMLAFPTAGSRGTWNAVRLAKAAGMDVRVVRP